MSKSFKTLNVAFDMPDYIELEKRKGNRTWQQFILESAEVDPR